MRRYFNLIRNLKNWRLYFALKYGGLKRDPLVFVTRSGVKCEVPLRLLQTFKEIFVGECYMRGMEHSRLGPPPAVILDIGANAGYFSLFAASRFTGARIFSFEPVPANFRQLERNKELNPHCGIEVFPMAVAGQSGHITLSFDPRDSFTTSATICQGADSGNEEFRVPSKSLPDIFNELGIDRLDLLKMDCEGSEYDILYNCPDSILARVRQIAMEVHSGSGPDQDIQSMDAFLRQKGFSTRQRPVGMLWAWR